MAIFTISEDLKDYMERKNKSHIVVEVAESNASDFEVTEIYYRLCNSKHAAYLIEKKGYKPYPLNMLMDPPEEKKPHRYGAEADGKAELKILLKPYRFEIKDEVHFYRKKSFFITHISASGISL